jgi:putative SOS response-associated peptidase YedK
MCGRHVSLTKPRSNASSICAHRVAISTAINGAIRMFRWCVSTLSGECTGSLLHWVPILFWAGWGAAEVLTTTATVEKFAEAATRRGPWSRGRRCIVPALGFCEWQVKPDGKRQPFGITLNDQDVIDLLAYGTPQPCG